MIQIPDAAKLVKREHLDGAIILHFKGIQFGCASYGLGRAECRIMQKIADQIMDKISSGDIEIPKGEQQK